jgi:hypothetical protein
MDAYLMTPMTESDLCRKKINSQVAQCGDGSRQGRQYRPTSSWRQAICSFLICLLCVFPQQLSAQRPPFICDDDYDCLPNGTCGTDQRCHCSSKEFIGEQCELRCPLDCRNDATCKTVDEHGGIQIEFYCDCPSGFTGGLCQNGGEAEAKTQDMKAVTANGHNGNNQTLLLGVTIGISTILILLMSAVVMALICRLRRKRETAIKTEKEQQVEVQVPGELSIEDLEIPQIS